MRLTILDRLGLLNVLPQQGDLVTVLVMRKLRTRLMLTEDELTRWGVKMEDTKGGTVTWKENGETEMEVTPKMMELGRTALAKLDEKGGVTESYLGLFEKFGLMDKED